MDQETALVPILTAAAVFPSTNDEMRMNKECMSKITTHKCDFEIIA
jgi:hypothetical protein